MLLPPLSATPVIPTAPFSRKSPVTPCATLNQIPFCQFDIMLFNKKTSVEISPPLDIATRIAYEAVAVGSALLSNRFPAMTVPGEPRTHIPSAGDPAGHELAQSVSRIRLFSISPLPPAV